MLRLVTDRARSADFGHLAHFLIQHRLRPLTATQRWKMTFLEDALNQTQQGRGLLQKLSSDQANLVTLAEGWLVLSKRFVGEAKGRVTVFSHPADAESLWVTTLLPGLLDNPAVLEIEVNIERGANG
jgi:hypothetical protein